MSNMKNDKPMEQIAGYPELLDLLFDRLSARNAACAGDVRMNTIFPLTTERFCKIQEQLNGRPVSEDWHEIIDRIVPIINDSYEMGRRRQARETFDVDTIARKAATRPENIEFVRRFGATLEIWCRIAHEAGGNVQE